MPLRGFAVLPIELLDSCLQTRRLAALPVVPIISRPEAAPQLLAFAIKAVAQLPQCAHLLAQTLAFGLGLGQPRFQNIDLLAQRRYCVSALPVGCILLTAL